MSWLRSLTRSLCALLLLTLPILGNVGGGGDSGWINLPGGAAAMSTSWTSKPRMVVTQPMSSSLQLMLPANMAGAVGLVQAANGTTALRATPDNVLTFTEQEMEFLVRAGLTKLRVTLVAPSCNVLLLSVELDPASGNVTVVVH